MGTLDHLPVSQNRRIDRAPLALGPRGLLLTLTTATSEHALPKDRLEASDRDGLLLAGSLIGARTGQRRGRPGLRPRG